MKIFFQIVAWLATACLCANTRPRPSFKVHDRSPEKLAELIVEHMLEPLDNSVSDLLETNKLFNRTVRSCVKRRALAGSYDCLEYFQMGCSNFDPNYPNEASAMIMFTEHEVKSLPKDVQEDMLEDYEDRFDLFSYFIRNGGLLTILTFLFSLSSSFFSNQVERIFDIGSGLLVSFTFHLLVTHFRMRMLVATGSTRETVDKMKMIANHWVENDRHDLPLHWILLLAVYTNHCLQTNLQEYVQTEPSIVVAAFYQFIVLSVLTTRPLVSRLRLSMNHQLVLFICLSLTVVLGWFGIVPSTL